MKLCGKGLRILLLATVLLLLAAECLLRALVPDRLLQRPVDRSFRIYLPEKTRRHPHSQAATNILRVALVGDSVTAGVGNHRCDRFGERLEWLLNLNDGMAPAEVLTYAKPTATYQQDKLLGQALEGGARLVVFIIHLSDTENWSNAQRLVPLRSRMDVAEAPAWLQPALDHSVLAHLIYDRGVERRERVAELRYYEYLYAADYTGLDKFRSALVRYRAACEQRGARMAAVLMPLLDQDLRPDRYPFQKPHRIVREACRDAGIPFCDLLPAFRYAAAERVVNIAGVDHHPNEIGHRLATDAILRFLLDEKLIAEDYAPRRLEDLALIQKWQRKLRAFRIPFDDPARADDLTEK